MQLHLPFISFLFLIPFSGSVLKINDQLSAYMQPKTKQKLTEKSGWYTYRPHV
jgi:hypothetical protein